MTNHQSSLTRALSAVRRAWNAGERVQRAMIELPVDRRSR